MLALLKTFLMWIFFMAWQGDGHEDWNWIKAGGMALLAIGTIWYIKLDIDDLDRQSAADVDSIQNVSQLQMSFGEFSKTDKTPTVTRSDGGYQHHRITVNGSSGAYSNLMKGFELSK